MPTVATDGALSFVIWPNQRQYEPPHVHVFGGGQELCRINLDSGTFLKKPQPPVGMNHAILEAYGRHVEVIRRRWEEIHGR